MRSRIFHIACLVLCTLGELSLRSVAETQEFQLLHYDSDQKSSACVEMAAKLGSCLAAVTPLSILTTMEESECCASILAFQTAGCHCLTPQSLDAVAKADRWAYKRRINTLRKVHQRCGWGGFTCPGQRLANSLLGVDIDTKIFEQMLSSSDIASWAIDQNSMIRGTSDAASWSNRWIEDRDNQESPSILGSSDSQEIASLIAQSSSGSRDSRLTELTDYVRAAVELADAMSQAEVSQVEISIELVVESLKEEDQAAPLLVLRQNCLTKVLTRSLAEVWLTLNIWLTLSVLCLMACLIALFLRRQTGATAADTCTMNNIISAAEEAAAFSKASNGEESLSYKL